MSPADGLIDHSLNGAIGLNGNDLMQARDALLRLQDAADGGGVGHWGLRLRLRFGGPCVLRGPGRMLLFAALALPLPMNAI